MAFPSTGLLPTRLTFSFSNSHSQAFLALTCRTINEPFALSHFIRKEFANEVMSQESSRRLIRLRRKQSTRTSHKISPKGMPCLCENCLQKRWSAFQPKAEVTPKKTVLNPFFSKDNVSFERWQPSISVHMRARQASGFAECVVGPSRL